MVTAVTTFAVRVDLGMTNLYHAAATGMQHPTTGDDAGADVMIDHHLNDVLTAA